MRNGDGYDTLRINAAVKGDRVEMAFTLHHSNGSVARETCTYRLTVGMARHLFNLLGDLLDELEDGTDDDELAR